MKASHSPEAAADDALLSQIEQHPSRFDPYLVYADTLQQRGDPRGELIVLQYERHNTRDPARRAAIRRAEDELIATHASALAGPAVDSGVKVRWFMGFAREVSLGDDTPHTADLVVRLLAHPGMRFLQTLRVGATRTAFTDVTEALARTHHTCLRELRIADWGTLWSENPGVRIEADPPRAIDLGDLRGLGDWFPRLETLHLGGRAALPAGGGLHRLTVTAELTEAMFTTLLGSNWVGLEELRIWLSPAQTYADRLAPLLDREATPGLRRLGICSTRGTDLLGALLSSRLLSQLKQLDLRHTPLTDADVVELARNKGLLSHLREGLFVDRLYLSEEGKRMADSVTLGLVPGESMLLGLARRGILRLVRDYLARAEPHPQEVSEALFPAADAGHVEVLRELVARGGDVTATDVGWRATALARASMSGHLNCVDFLLDEGADPNVLDRFGYTPLMRACFSGHARIARRLLESGANPRPSNADGLDALMLAAGEGHADVVRVWLELDLPTDREIRGRTALDEARHFNRTRIIAMLEA